MKNDHPPDSRDVNQLPNGWEPEADRDPRWDAMIRLMREADHPELPPPSAFGATKLEIRRQLAAESLLRPRKNHEHPGFGEWLRLLLSGGGLGAQAVRFGAVATVALLVGVQMNSAPTGSLPVRTESIVSTTINPIQPTPDTGSVATVAFMPTPTPVANAYNGGAIDRSYMDERENAEAWARTAPASQSWVFGSTPTGRGDMRAVSLSDGRVDAAASPGRTDADLASQALEHLQILKFYSIVNREDQDLPHLRSIEQILTRLVETNDGQRDARTEALERYRQAEYALAAQRFGDAQLIFEDVALRAPGTSLAFLARFQIGRICYEKTQDYDLALESFQSCLDDFGNLSIPVEYRRYLSSRVDILRASQADQWASLRDWSAAEKATTPSAAVSSLLKVVSHSPSDKLTADAADRLMDLAIADTQRRELDHNAILDGLRDRASRMRAGQEAARVHFAIGEITARRAQNFGQALQDFQLAMQYNTDPALNQIIHSRITVLANKRLVGLTAGE